MVEAVSAPEEAWPAAVQRRLREFASARDWERHHTPRNLLLALTAEVGELAELYQWCAEDELPAHDRVQDEVADVAMYLLRFADIAGVDVAQAVTEKIARNELRFPPKTSTAS
jgi:NTP pyrophosphatase (non-canonical NTP hydrolase)